MAINPEEAAVIYAKLGEDLAQFATIDATALSRLTISEDGWIDRDAIKAFLSQIYPDKKLLSVHTGRLFGRLVQLGAEREIEARCFDCGGYARSASCKTPHDSERHLRGKARLLMRFRAIEIAELPASKFTGRRRFIGASTTEDFELLKSHL